METPHHLLRLLIVNRILEKLECVGHVQERLGTRLRNKIKEYKGTMKHHYLERGKLTDKVINYMQDYYGIAIEINKDELYAMKKAVGAILWHCTSIENTEFRHQFFVILVGANTIRIKLNTNQQSTFQSGYMT